MTCSITAPAAVAFIPPNTELATSASIAPSAFEAASTAMQLRIPAAPPPAAACAVDLQREP